MKERCGEKIKLTSYEELLGASAEEGSVDIDILKIRDFEKHPFKVLDDEKMVQDMKTSAEEKKKESEEMEHEEQ